MSSRIRFCGYCGSPIAQHDACDGRRTTVVCVVCGNSAASIGRNSGPALLVLTQIFANDRILLMKRGWEPYKGKWAPPGGFVESGESLETAAIRECWEEVRIALDRTQLLPHAVVSIPKINQVYHIFIARLNEMVPASAVVPESLDVGWFSEDDLAGLDMWDPAASVDTDLLFEGVRTGRFDFYQQTDDFSRVITERGLIRYLWRQN